MKMVIVMRTDLNMRKGKMVAQGAHAAVMPFISREASDYRHPLRGFLETWVYTGMKKICVGIGSHDELMRLTIDAAEAQCPFFIVQDAGHTEVPTGTMTCVAFGPFEEEKLDKITGHLKLL